MQTHHLRSALALLLLSACGTERDGGEITDGGIGPLNPVALPSGPGDAGAARPGVPGAVVPPAAGAVGGMSPGSQTVANVPPIAIDHCGVQNPANLSAAQISALKAGGGQPPRVLYPYDGTVFPRGIGAPTIMWEDDGAAAAYVHLKSPLFEYAGCLPVQGGVIQIPDDVWNEAGVHSHGGADSMAVEVTSLSRDGARGPAKLSITASSATLKGSLYYNSYSSKLASGGLGGGGLGGGGAVLRVRAGRDAELFARTGTCSGCHSLSANGQRLIATNLGGIGGLGGGGLFGGGGGGGGGLPGIGGGGGDIYVIAPDTPANPQPARTGANASFAGISPDGRFYINSAAQAGFGPLLNGGLATPPAQSALYETDTGRNVPSGVPSSAMMPTFSTDGKLIAFVNLAQSNGRNITLMDFDLATGAATNARVIYTATQGNVGWPFILPDNRAVVFTLTESDNFGGGSAGITPGLWQGPRSDLMIADIATGKTRMLAKAMGYASPADAQAEKSYMPFGQVELHQVYYPTISPVAAGGYFWVFFDSVRHFGNKGISRQIWGSAIRIPSGEFNEYEEDPSLPAFYVRGQEFGTANHRGFTALDPCHKDGESCESGVDCCSGFCTNGVCGLQVPRCSLAGETCKTRDDCCDKTQECIGGFCSDILR
jgi:hypothetical protein